MTLRWIAAQSFFRVGIHGPAGWLRWGAVLVLLTAVTNRPCLSIDTNHSHHKSFGTMQIYEGTNDIWIFLDVDNVSVGGGSEGFSFEHVASVALRLDGQKIDIFHTVDPGLTANAHITSFLRTDNVVYAVKRDLTAAWLFAHEEQGGNIVKAVPVRDVADKFGGRDTLRAAVANVDKETAFQMTASENSGYGNISEEGFESPGKKISISFERNKAPIGSDAIEVSVISQDTALPHTRKLTIDDMMPAQ